jgi:hypothetical protein
MDCFTGIVQEDLGLLKEGLEQKFYAMTDARNVAPSLLLEGVACDYEFVT